MTDDITRVQATHDLKVTLPAEINLSVAAESLTRAALFADPTLTPRAMRRMMARAAPSPTSHNPERHNTPDSNNPDIDTPDIETLSRQAQVLDILFHRLVVKALSSPYKNTDGSPKADYVDDARLDLALRAQRQCRNTLGTAQLLRALKSGNKNIFDEQTNDGA